MCTHRHTLLHVVSYYVALHSLIYCTAYLLPSYVCRHILFTPQRYHVGTDESFSLTSYSQDVSVAEAVVSYEECTCINGRRTCDSERGGIFSQDRGLTRRGMDTYMYMFSSIPVTACTFSSLFYLAYRPVYKLVNACDGIFGFWYSLQVIDCSFPILRWF